MLRGLKNVATWIRECDEPAFARVLANYPEIQYWNARTQRVPKDFDGLLLSGGEDISQKFLRQPVPDPSLIQDANPARDEWEFPALAAALKAQLPILAICRGLQVLNVALGGTLHLDIPRHDDDKFNNVQPLRYTPEARIRFDRVNSSHHQALDQLGQGLVVEAWHAEDGTIEQARLENYPYCLAVQYHPERDPLYRPLFDGFIEQVTREPAWA
jgi:putative glutamine amidotransferase